MKIFVKNVKFGDCSLIYNCKYNDSLLIDCGSSNRGNNPNLKSSKFAFAQIEDEINKKEIRNLMITHFDKDHFNGVLEIPDKYKFENTYLPYSIIDYRCIYSETIGILLAIAPKNSWGFKLSKQIVELFFKLNKISKNIKFVQKGDYIKFGHETINILWPEIKTVEIFSAKIGKSPINNIHETLISNELISNFVDSLNRYLWILQSENSENYFQEFQESYFNLISNRQNIIENYKNALEININQYCYAKYSELIHCMNAISIVCDCEKYFIFLGDVPVNVVEYLKKDFKAKYELVKIPHHATKQYYSAYIPNGNTYIISNGGYKNRGVYNKYLNVDGEFLCTQKDAKDKNCDFYKNKKHCCSKCSLSVNNPIML